MFGNRTEAKGQRVVKSPDVKKSHLASRVIVIGVGDAEDFGNNLVNSIASLPAILLVI